MADDHLDFGDEEYGGSQKMPYHGGGAIPALAEDEMLGDDDEYDDLYNDVNVGEGFLQLQRSQASGPSVEAGNGGSLVPRSNFVEPPAVPPAVSIPGVATEGKHGNSGVGFIEQKSGMTAHKGPEITRDSRVGNYGIQGPVSVPQKVGLEPVHMAAGKVANEPAPLLNPNAGVSRGNTHMPANPLTSNVNVNVNSPMVNENQLRHAVDNGNAMLFVGELHWWTTDAELESVLTQYGKVKEIKFFDERASGKSKGYCQVEFFDPASAAACKEGMNGYVFNGRACVVAFATPQTIKQMGVSYMNKTQAQVQAQPPGRRPLNEGGGRGGGTNYPSGDGGRNFGRGGWGRGQGMAGRGQMGGPGRGRGAMGMRNMMGNAPTNGGAFGQGMTGPFGGPPAGLMPPQGMMGPGFDPTYMGRGAGYGGFSGPAFPGMLPPFPAVNPMGLAGVAPHVNPAFFGRGMAVNGMGMMGTAGMDGPHNGMWPDMGQWGGEEHGRGTRESSYGGGEDNASEYGYGDEKGVRSTASREKERGGSDRDWSGHSDKRHHDERDRYEREHRYREEKDGHREYRQKERDFNHEDDWDKGQSSSRSRSRSRAMPEDDHRPRSRDADYGKRRRLSSE